SFIWTAPAALTLSDSTSASPTFTAPEVIADTIFVITLVVNDGSLGSDPDTVLVNVLPKLVVTYTKADITIRGGHDGWIDLSVSGGTPPFLYDWNTGAFTQDIISLYAGMYTVTVVDADIQSITLTIEITQPPPIQTCDTTVDFSYETDSVTQEVSFTPSTTDYELLWSFGDGRVSNLSAPANIYSHAGLYQVCLNAYDSVSDCSYKTCEMVEVGSPECVAGYDYYVDQSDSMLIHFTDNSYGAVSSWYWNFADGNVSTDQNVDHRYTKPGTYQVCLFTFDDATGCISEACKEISIGAIELVADFTYFVNSATLKATFRNNSLGNITDYYWTYGDGNVYSGKDSSHVYEEPVTYNVCLSIRNRDTRKFTETCKEIKVGTQPCNINATFAYFVDPEARKVTFTDVSSGTVHSHFWNFSDGNTSSSPDPVHQFSKPGYYLVSLSVRDTVAGCNDSQVELIQIGQAECKSMFRHSVDPATLKVSLEDHSMGNIQDYYWTFDDGFTSTGSNPVHQYNAPGMYEISLTVANATGTCMDQTSKMIQVGYVDCSADFTMFIDSATNTTYFNSQSLGRLINYYWIFGDGKMSVDQNPVHTFPVPGYHKVSLNTFNGLSGCMDYHEKVILVGRQGIDCEADFIYQVDEATNTITFADKSLGEGLTYFWNFGDENSSLVPNPVHKFEEEGFYNVCLTVYSSTGIQNITCKQVLVGAPAAENCLAKFLYTVDDELKVNYRDKSFGDPDRWVWEFGDDQTSDVQNPFHTFAEAGYYTSHQRIENQATGCVSDAFALVSVAMEGGLIADFGYTYDNTITKKADTYPVDFVGVSLGDASKLKWSFGDGTYDSTTTTPRHVYNAPGVYEVCLTVYDEMAGTKSITCHSVQVPQATSAGYIYANPDIMLQCYPNPANDHYFVLFDLPSASYTQVGIYTISGKKIRSVINKKLSMGRHLFELDAADMPNGLYIIKLNSNIRMVTQIMSIQH
ncbi:MAG: PKD domain-containing protein, partial [Bacteroidales bacterium]|nr:PKD domain-containing protein [Bacteroidales bacterium]